MIPAIVAPSIQVAPPVDTSVFTAQASDAALGRLPVAIVPQAVSNPKVADDNRNGQQLARNTQAAIAVANASTPAFTLGGTGEIAFESPYSTGFMAQLFGQFAAGGGDGASLLGAAGDGFVDFETLATFDLLKYKPSLAFKPPATPKAPLQNPLPDAPQPAPVQVQQRPAPQAAPVQPVIQQAAPQPVAPAATGGIDLRTIPVVSSDAPPVEKPAQSPARENAATLFVSGAEAYLSTQSRNAAAYAPDTRSRSGVSEVSLVL